jgi:hypothetical protein
MRETDAQNPRTLCRGEWPLVAALISMGRRCGALPRWVAVHGSYNNSKIAFRD